jgi:hypothetical protein
MRRTNILLLLLLPLSALGEPYLAVRTGLDCAACHVNPGGGGQRNDLGNQYAATQLAARALPGDDAELLGALLGGALTTGANARWSYRSSDVSDRDDNDSFETDRVSLYLTARLNKHVTLYLDERVAPGGALNREAWVKLSHDAWYLRAGRIYLPFGWRLEDDSAFIRQTTGINFDNPDNGVELGYMAPNWNIQLSLGNGTAGAAEVDDGKQASLRAEYIGGPWRIGISGNSNHTDNGEREMYGLFAGLQTGPVSWLAEWDRVEDSGFGAADRQLDIALLEANWAVLAGHNLKLTLESIGSDRADEPDRLRGSLIWEYFPWNHIQVRAGVREYDSDNEIPLDNREEGFLQLHVFF